MNCCRLVAYLTLGKKQVCTPLCIDDMALSMNASARLEDVEDEVVFTTTDDDIESPYSNTHRERERVR